MKLRAYEKDWIQRIRKASGRVLIVGPTGSGKTVVAAHLIQGFIRDGKRVLFVAHRRELILQCLQRLQERGVKDVGVIMAGHEPHPEHPVQVASIQTLTRRNSSEFDVVFIDEAHRAPAASYRKVLDANQDALLYGLTATPRRLDGKPLDDLFDTIVQSAPVSKLIEQGYIAKPRIWSKRAPDLKDTKIKRGDYDRADLAKKVNRRELVGDIVDHWQRLAAGKSTVVYAVDVAHAEAIAARFRARLKRKGAVAVLTGETPQEQRRQMLEDFEGGKVLVLVNVEVLVEGWDSRRASCCVLARPTLSETFLFQTSGRVMRPHGNHGGSPIILDHAGNFNRHGLYPFDDRVWSFEEVPKRKGDAPTKECPECGNTCTFGAQVCSCCGYRFWERKPPKEVAEYLVELRKSPMQRAVELYGELGNIKKVAKEMGVRGATVRRWLCDTGLISISRVSKEEIAKAVSLYVKTNDTTLVANKFGVKPGTVYKWANQSGVYKTEERERVRRLALSFYKKTGNASLVSRKLGVTANAVRRWASEDGLDTSNKNNKKSLLLDKAIELYAELKSSIKVANRIGVNHRTIRSWLNDAGVNPRRKYEALRKKAVRLYPKLKSVHKVADSIGVKPTTVSRWLHEAGVEVKNRRYKGDELRERAVKLYPKLRSASKVAEVLCVSKHSVLRWLRDAGIDTSQKRKASA